MFCCEYCEFFKNNFFYRTPPVAASGQTPKYTLEQTFLRLHDCVHYQRKNGSFKQANEGYFYFNFLFNSNLFFYLTFFWFWLGKTNFLWKDVSVANHKIICCGKILDWLKLFLKCQVQTPAAKEFFNSKLPRVELSNCRTINLNKRK